MELSHDSPTSPDSVPFFFNPFRHMVSDTFLVTVVVTAAALWLGVRMWKRAKAKYRSGPCCGEGCGCSGPVLFGPKKKRKR